ncbi:hypothetical protein IWW56_002611 [Coemansia sp. RSA 2131]|nr:hypothetical protein IWW56_002611 [Coemansia sp. RSA 2131]
MRPDPYKQKASRRYQATHKSAQAKDSAPDTKEKTAVKEAPPAPAPAHKGGKYSRRQIHDNTWRYDDNVPESTSDVPLNSIEAAEAREEENVRDFLSYLEEKSQSFANDQSAVYFQLRAEADSVELDSYNDDTWKQLVEINWDGLLDTAASMPLRKLLDVDEDIALPDGVADTVEQSEDSVVPTVLPTMSQAVYTKVQQSVRANTPKPSAADLAPGIGASSSNTTFISANSAPQASVSTIKPSTAPKAPTFKSKPNAVPELVTQKHRPPAKPVQSVDELEAFLDEIL